ncbi:MAG TPA: FtsX-like permease family protein [Dinghuibacter sp.]|uniref:ABC transporter permease n=1 Tax=Dinghuibacter sp. TaxID=2024697 RepID=UPI002B7E7002|nr:FtsX-like permease family protein [Dinghuibacter sp.]HTJ11194.1 FtsX-like permease family protein [Dinghuibacter sp.]
MLRIIFRQFRRRRGYAAINVLGLALGICISLIIYRIVRYETGFDDFHPGGDRIYRVVCQEKDGQGNVDGIGFVQNPLPGVIRQETSAFDNVTEFWNYYARVSVPGGKRFYAARRGEEVSPVIITEPSYFDLFRYQWLAGRVSDEPFTVVLTESQATRYFGPRPPDQWIGRDLYYGDVWTPDSLHLTVSGIVKDWEGQSDLAFKDFISFATIRHSFLAGEIHLDHWGNWSPTTQAFVRLAKGVSKTTAEAAFPGIVRRHVPPYTGHIDELRLQPLSDLHFNSLYRDDYVRKGSRPALYALMAVAVFILLIACINFINLSTSLSLQRAREVGVRKTLGSSLGQLRRQFLLETLALTVMAAALALLAATPAFGLARSLAPQGMTLRLWTPDVFVFLALLTVTTTLVAGFYPARVLASLRPVESLKGMTGYGGGGFLRRALIVFQFTVSLVFIIGTLVIGNQVRYILRADMGIKHGAIVTLYTGWNDGYEKASRFAERIRNLAGVKSVSVHQEAPAAKTHPMSNLRRVDDPSFSMALPFEVGDEHYVLLFGLQLRAGRNIRHSDTVSEFLLNESATRALGYRTPEAALGARLQVGFDDSRGTVVGILRDFHAQSLRETIAPFFFTSYAPGERAVSISMSSDVLRPIRALWEQYYPNERFDYHFLDDSIARLYETEQKTERLMNIAMGVAIFISCMGLIGLATYTAQRRAREIAIRKVLGARVYSLLALLSGEFVRLTLLAFLIASPIAWYFTYSWLQDFAYRVSIGVGVFAAAGLVAVALTVLSTGYQALRAARANPVDKLRAIS